MRRAIARAAALLTLGASVSTAAAADAARAAAPAPAVRIDAGPDGRTRDRQPIFQFSSDERGASFDCRIVAVGADAERPAFHPCVAVDLPAAELADGDYRFEVRATGAAGTRGPLARRRFTVETLLTTPPPLSRECRASLSSLRGARRAVIGGQRTLARAQAAERRARARGAADGLKQAIRRRTGAQRQLARAGKRLLTAQRSAERRCR
ncbi:hypothetical protein Q5424_25695 [Conexibacter sp. JD483]|uniref:hypothetical protein n=1 Tax=unclassified Conexibacter TaxID=2627773 RepID=UPI00272028A3|nr:MULTISPECIES: hypothetical protein [unclassified Conexibacter]MDO8189084.1 hypothetical protein [Conexibacter sp. CPCC 205706]MDO8201869.1 hypothetical protein [Conexibacter sp. CPCC 205762]MDR9372518.1 hypothetical protein [Conexibacter sp. JD483]